MKYDVAIGGAGFAGLMIARELARGGLKVAVFEKSNELSGILFEMAGLSPAGQGASLAADFITKGKAKAKINTKIRTKTKTKTEIREEGRRKRIKNKYKGKDRDTGFLLNIRRKDA